MNILKRVFLVSVLLTLLAAGFFVVWPASEETGMVVISAAPGTVVRVHYEVDGAQFDLEQAVPVEFRTSGHEFSCAISGVEQTGPISVSLVVNDMGSARTVGQGHQNLQCGFSTGRHMRGPKNLWANAVEAASAEEAL